MKRLVALATIVLGLSACGTSDTYKVENGVCTRHYRTWIIWSIGEDTSSVKADNCTEVLVP